MGFSSHAQTKTRTEKEKEEREASPAKKYKVMLIPFEPRLYMGEIDHHIHSETRLSSKEIKHRFRDGLNEQLQKAFKSKGFSTLDLMDDTLKYKKDIEGIYQYVAYDYLKVPQQDPYSPPVREKKEKTIEKGQLNVETNSDARFMNARVTNAKVVPLLYGKYKTNVYVFINQLDIKASNSVDPGLQNSGASKRRIVVHYTVYSLDAKQINSGTVEEDFDVELNNPKRIIDKHFQKIASTIVLRVNKGLMPPVQTK